MTREEAIEVYNGLINTKIKEAFEFFAPELKETEDERIRKHLIEIVETYWGKTTEPGKAADLAWLEKQKEQKPVEYLDKDKVYAIMTKLHDLAFSQRILIDSDEYKKIDEITSDVRSLLDYPIEQKPADNEKVKMTDFEQSVYDLCPVLGIEEAKATASDLLELAKKTLLKTGKVVLASNYPEGCSFEDGFHLGYNEGFNAKKEQKPSWGEEDETSIAVKNPEAYKIGFADGEAYAREQKEHWKPSEEQMKELNKVRTLNPGLDALYQQLKNM